MLYTDTDAANRQRADAFLTQFKASARPYDLCRALLMDATLSVYVRFVAIATWRDALMREWSMLEPEAVQQMQTFLVQLIQTPLVCRMHILSVRVGVYVCIVFIRSGPTQSFPQCARHKSCSTGKHHYESSFPVIGHDSQAWMEGPRARIARTLPHVGAVAADRATDPHIGIVVCAGMLV